MEEGEALIGRQVRKDFPPHGFFSGTVESYDAKEGLYAVRYEDDDVEEYNLEELYLILQKKRGRPKKIPGAPPAPRVSQSAKLHATLLQSRRAPTKADPDSPPPPPKVVSAVKASPGPKAAPAKPAGRLTGLLQQQTIPAAWRETAQAASAHSARQLARGRGAAGDDGGDGAGLTFMLALPAPGQTGLGGKWQESEAATDSREFPCFLESAKHLTPMPLPPADPLLDAPPEAVLNLMAAYAFLRSFSQQLFLSPCTLEQFVSAVASPVANPLTDCIHLGLLRAAADIEAGNDSSMGKKSSKDSTAPYEYCDLVTWPEFLLPFLVERGFRPVNKKLRRCFSQMGRISYYSLDVCTKASVLSFLCDEALESLRVRFELDRRELEVGPGAEQEDARLEAMLNGEDLEEDQQADTADISAAAASNAVDGRDSGEGEQGATTAAADVPAVADDVEPVEGDGNADDCKLCGMNGNLICCDGCPCSFHARCVGILASALPQGAWYCPECAMERSGTLSAARPQGLRVPSAGTDDFLRTFWVLCSRVLEAEPGPDSTVLAHQYKAAAVPRLLPVLEASAQSEASQVPQICSAIRASLQMPGSPKQDERSSAEEGLMEKNAADGSKEDGAGPTCNKPDTNAANGQSATPRADDIACSTSKEEAAPSGIAEPSRMDSGTLNGSEEKAEGMVKAVGDAVDSMRESGVPSQGPLLSQPQCPRQEEAAGEGRKTPERTAQFFSSVASGTEGTPEVPACKKQVQDRLEAVLQKLPIREKAPLKTGRTKASIAGGRAHSSLATRLPNGNVVTGAASAPAQQMPGVAAAPANRKQRIWAEPKSVPVDPGVFEYENAYALGEVSAAAVLELWKPSEEEAAKVDQDEDEDDDANAKRRSRRRSRGGSGPSSLTDQTRIFNKVMGQVQWLGNESVCRRQALKEKCGWCVQCQTPSNRKPCLLLQAERARAATQGTGAWMWGKRLRRGAKHHVHKSRDERLVAVASRLLALEAELTGVLDGPWEDPAWRRHWRGQVLEAQDISDCADLLKQLGYGIRTVALLRDWANEHEAAPPVNFLSAAATGPAVASFAPWEGDGAPGTGGRGARGRRKSQGAAAGRAAFEAALAAEVAKVRKTRVQWYRGSAAQRRVEDWEGLPQAALRRAARTGCRKKIPGLVYGWGGAVRRGMPIRTQKCAWTYRVEQAATAGALALQIRAFESMIRWDSLLHSPGSSSGSSSVFAAVRTGSSSGSSAVAAAVAPSSPPQLKELFVLPREHHKPFLKARRWTPERGIEYWLVAREEVEEEDGGEDEEEDEEEKKAERKRKRMAEKRAAAKKKAKQAEEETPGSKERAETAEPGAADPAPQTPLGEKVEGVSGDGEGVTPGDTGMNNSQSGDANNGEAVDASDAKEKGKKKKKRFSVSETPGTARVTRSRIKDVATPVPDSSSKEGEAAPGIPAEPEEDKRLGEGRWVPETEVALWLIRDFEQRRRQELWREHQLAEQEAHRQALERVKLLLRPFVVRAVAALRARRLADQANAAVRLRHLDKKGRPSLGQSPAPGAVGPGRVDLKGLEKMARERVRQIGWVVRGDQPAGGLTPGPGGPGTSPMVPCRGVGLAAANVNCCVCLGIIERHSLSAGCPSCQGLAHTGCSLQICAPPPSQQQQQSGVPALLEFSTMCFRCAAGFPPLAHQPVPGTPAGPPSAQHSTPAGRQLASRLAADDGDEEDEDGSGQKGRRRCAKKDQVPFVLPGTPGNRKSTLGYYFANDCGTEAMKEVLALQSRVGIKGRNARVLPSSGASSGAGAAGAVQDALQAFKLGGGPACKLCKAPYDGSHFYVGCNFCEAWFHGETLQLDEEEDVPQLWAFKCNRCRKAGSRWGLCPGQQAPAPSPFPTPAGAEGSRAAGADGAPRRVGHAGPSRVPSPPQLHTPGQTPTEGVAQALPVLLPPDFRSPLPSLEVPLGFGPSPDSLPAQPFLHAEPHMPATDAHQLAPTFSNLQQEWRNQRQQMQQGAPQLGVPQLGAQFGQAAATMQPPPGFMPLQAMGVGMGMHPSTASLLQPGLEGARTPRAVPPGQPFLGVSPALGPSRDMGEGGSSAAPGSSALDAAGDARRRPKERAVRRGSRSSARPGDKGEVIDAAVEGPELRGTSGFGPAGGSSMAPQQQAQLQFPNLPPAMTMVAPEMLGTVPGGMANVRPLAPEGGMLAPGVHRLEAQYGGTQQPGLGPAAGVYQRQSVTQVSPVAGGPGSMLPGLGTLMPERLQRVEMRLEKDLARAQQRAAVERTPEAVQLATQVGRRLQHLRQLRHAMGQQTSHQAQRQPMLQEQQGTRQLGGGNAFQAPASQPMAPWSASGLDSATPGPRALRLPNLETLGGIQILRGAQQHQQQHLRQQHQSPLRQQQQHLQPQMNQQQQQQQQHLQKQQQQQQLQQQQLQQQLQQKQQAMQQYQEQHHQQPQQQQQAMQPHQHQQHFDQQWQQNQVEPRGEQGNLQTRQRGKDEANAQATGWGTPSRPPPDLADRALAGLNSVGTPGCKKLGAELANTPVDDFGGGLLGSQDGLGLGGADDIDALLGHLQGSQDDPALILLPEFGAGPSQEAQLWAPEGLKPQDGQQGRQGQGHRASAEAGGESDEEDAPLLSVFKAKAQGNEKSSKKESRKGRSEGGKRKKKDSSSGDEAIPIAKHSRTPRPEKKATQPRSVEEAAGAELEKAEPQKPEGESPAPVGKPAPLSSDAKPSKGKRTSRGSGDKKAGAAFERKVRLSEGQAAMPEGAVRAGEAPEEGSLLSPASSGFSWGHKGERRMRSKRPPPGRDAEEVQSGLGVQPAEQKPLPAKRRRKEAGASSRAQAQAGGRQGTGACHVCNLAEPGAELECAECRVQVHGLCYAWDKKQKQKGCWKCDACTKGIPPDQGVCLLCPTRGGALKETKKGEWVHSVCFLWHPETFMVGLKVDGINKIPKAHWSTRCCHCDLPQGAVIECSRHGCRAAFHPLCNRKEGHPVFPLGNKYYAFCSDHAATVE